MWERDKEAAPTAGAIGQIERGLIRPTVATMELLAATLEVEPSHFVEYRLALARRQLDERQVGLKAAVEMLEFQDEALRAARVSRAATDARVATQQSPERSPRKRPAKAKRG
jgi:transcriptional regulator with XRE-family HTH domain